MRLQALSNIRNFAIWSGDDHVRGHDISNRPAVAAYVSFEFGLRYDFRGMKGL